MRHSKPQSHLQYGLTQGRALTIYRALRWMVLATVLGLAWLNQAQADATQGLAWLQGQVLSSGKISNKSRFGTVPQVQCEVAQTLLRLAGNNSQITSIVNAMPSSGDNVPTESLACWQILKTQQGAQVTSPLSPRFISDKGYSTYPDEMVPGIIDTAWGYATIATPSASLRQGVMQWLMSKQSNGMLKAGGYANLYTTAVVLRAISTDALKDSGTLALAQTLAQALLSKQAPSGAWGESQMLTSLVFEAVHPYTASTPQVATNVQTYLLAAQKSDGSWETDPYTTALALRALALVTVKPTDPGQQANSGTVMGLVTDGNSNTPLENATVTVTPATGGAPISVQTDAQGLYEIVVSPAGQVGLSATKEGYSLVSGTGVVQARGTLTFSTTLSKVITIDPPINPDPMVTTAIVQGTVTQATNGSPIAGVSISVKNSTAGSTYNATTDAAGKYSITNIAAGAVVLSANKSGWISASGTVNLPAGSTGIFSPTLIEVNSSDATSVLVTGQVIDAATKAPLPGVAVSIQGPSSQTTGTSGADGKFSMTAPIGAITLKYSLAGYGTITQSATSVIGSRIDAGIVEMSASRQTSVLHGLVTDTTGAAIPNATVAVGAISATTNSAGAYVLDGLTGNAWSVQVSASGFQPRAFQLTIAEPGDITQDFVIPAGAGFLDLTDLIVTPTTTSLNKPVKAGVKVKNSSTAASTTSVVLEIQGPGGDVVAILPALDIAGIPLGDVTLSPGDLLDITFDWNTASHAAGKYAMVVKLVEPGSRSKDNPTGVVTGSLRSGIEIIPQAAFSGSTSAEPPVVQVGSDTPVTFTALIKNNGNVVLPASSYLLKVSDSTTNELVYQTTAQVPSIALGALQEISFGTWMPNKAASLKVEVTAGIAPGAVIQSSLYVGDMAKAEFTVDKPVVPPGDQTVKGKIRIAGLDMASGSSTDPLAPVIRDAVIKAVRYGDDYAYKHHISDLKCFACHVQTQAVVGGERNLRFAQPLDQNKRNELLNAILQAIDKNGVVQSSTGPQTNTYLALWATKEWHAPDEVASSNRKLAEALISMANSGQWSPDYSSSWWASTGRVTGLNTATLVDYSKLLKEAGPGTIKTNAFATISNLSTGDKRFAVSSDGKIYVGNKSNKAVFSVDLVNSQATQIATGLPVQNIRPLANGKLIVAATNGVYISDAVGAPIKISNQASADVIELAGGGYLLKAYGQTKLYKLDDNGVLTEFVSSSLLESSGGQLEQEPDGSILVTNPSQNRILRFELNGAFRDTPATYTNGTPYQLVKFGNQGYLLSTSNGLYWYNENWVVERLTFSAVNTAIPLPDGSLLWSDNSTINRMSFASADASVIASKIDVTLSQSAAKLVTGSIFVASNNLDAAFRMIGLSKLREYYQGTSHASEFDSLIYEISQTLWGRQNKDGGWGQSTSYTTSDPVVTAIVGVALDFTNPSRSDPRLRQAIQYVLAQQKADGSWLSTQGLGGSLLSSTWIEIWLPTMLDRLGALDADLVVNFAANTTPSNLQPPPTKTTPQADGSTEYLWSFTGITDTGREVNFDLALANMAIEEVRPAAQIASLKFQNSFVSGEVVAPIVVPRIAANANIGIKALTDKPIYTSEETAIFSGPVTNNGITTRDAQVRFTVLDSNNEVVATLPLPPSVNIAAGQTVSVDSSWSVSSVLASDYVLLAELVSPEGTAYASATADFSIQASQAQRNSARVRTDRTSYTTGQTVQITSQLSNLTQNTVQDNVQVQTTVFNSNNQAVWSRSETIAQLTPAAQREYKYSLAAATLPTGNYTVREQLLDAQNHLLAQDSTPFSVQADPSGQNLNGQISASPHALLVGSTIQFTASVTNRGNTPMSNLPVTVQVVDIEQNTILAQFAQTISIPVGASQPLQPIQWATQGRADATHLVVLSANVSGTTIALAQDNLRLSDPTVDPGIDPNPGPGPDPGPGPNPAPNPHHIPWGNPWLLALFMALTSGFALRQRRR